MNIHWKDWCQSWNSNNLATRCEELTHLKRPWCWERLKAGGEGDNRGRDGWMASPTRWTWVWASSWSWWWTGEPGVLQSMGLQSRTRLNDWTELMVRSKTWTLTTATSTRCHSGKCRQLAVEGSWRCIVGWRNPSVTYVAPAPKQSAKRVYQ